MSSSGIRFRNTALLCVRDQKLIFFICGGVRKIGYEKSSYLAVFLSVDDHMCASGPFVNEEFVLRISDRFSVTSLYAICVLYFISCAVQAICFNAFQYFAQFFSIS